MTALKTILYMGSLHGFFTFYLPLQLTKLPLLFFNPGIVHYIAFPLWLIGAWCIIRCSIDMVRRGRGTPSHLDPPIQLITTGLYRHVRNPIYLGALLALLGYILWSGSGWVIAYFLCYAAAFHILIVFFEEPLLLRVFGEEYEQYRKKVPRWFPKLR